MTFMMVQLKQIYNEKMLFLKGAIARRLSTHWMATKNHDDWEDPCSQKLPNKIVGEIGNIHNLPQYAHSM